MAVDMFLELEGVKGESVDKVHKDKIDILAWSWGLSNTGTLHHGAGAGAGKANFQDISITKYIDAASPNLMLYCANGKHFGKGKLIVRKAGETPLEYLVIDLTKVMVASYSTGGSGGEERLTENVTLNFAQVKVEYVTQNEKGGKGTPQAFGWNIAENTKA
ncbi:MAG TPA: type VI secretion system tube protein Hcp [Steroidobacter sp.]|uniref:Hcp family type VI secretion system effector n=1 Tax=Steroidobacter sp. TaxID=1978227 RepID=UPI002EDB2D03